jgi:hypothetical protein
MQNGVPTPFIWRQYGVYQKITICDALCIQLLSVNSRPPFETSLETFLPLPNGNLNNKKIKQTN